MAAARRSARRTTIRRHGTQSGARRILQYRAVLDTRRLKEQFGYVPEYSSEDAFAAYLASR
ncbi:hypothetical protein R3Q06_15375 [Rhodococcus erythropolis]|uniref:hypothetical protein n=1 Tax=Rhodococcus erythropolis TaxID=1833 RepID=UPI002949E3B7|nr:hypothetical protein [Rhodococcus erythropolis]MDV6274880.1 hypothetical protein [Rhodococcus erythropolis]